MQGAGADDYPCVWSPEINNSASPCVAWAWRLWVWNSVRLLGLPPSSAACIDMLRRRAWDPAEIADRWAGDTYGRGRKRRACRN
ncbi:hypothetical protein VTH82DRAFT_5136 [Thermothelomyces myriococcoides]